MKNYRVFFHCMPAHEWRPCSDVVAAESPDRAVQTIKRENFKTYRLPVRGPYEAKETTDVPSPCWSPNQYIERKYFRVSYTWPGGKAHTVTSASSVAKAWETFANDNRHVTITQIEDEDGQVTTKKPNE